MKCQGDENNDDDCFEVPIGLHFEESTPRLRKIQSLDPEIIDLDCDSDEDSSFVSADPDDFSIPRTADTLHMPPITSSISNNAIKSKNVNNNLSGQIMDIDDNNANETVDNNRGICLDKGVHNYIDMKRVHKRLGTKMGVENRKKLLENYNRRNDVEKQRALKQRNKTTVDVKKNTGLVGMKIQRIICEKQTMKTKTTIKKTDQTSKKKNLQNVKAVDKRLINFDTKITPVFGSIKGFANESGISHQNVHEGSVKPINRKCKICDTLENENNAKHLKHVSQKTEIENGTVLAFMNGSVQIAEVIVRITTTVKKEISQKKEKQKPLNEIKVCNEAQTTEKTEKFRLNNQKHFDGSKITEIIAPMPLSIEARNKESVKSSEAIATCEKKEYTHRIQPASIPFKKKTDNKNIKHHQIHCSNEKISAKHASPQKSGSDVINKCKIINEFTEILYNKIEAMKHKPNKSHKKYAKKPSNFVQLKSTQECKSMPRIVNVTKNVPLGDKICKNMGLCTNFLDQSIKNNSIININDVKNTVSPKISKTQLQYLNENQLEDLSHTKKCHANHLHLPHNITHPLNPSFVKIAKTDAVINSKLTNSENNTQSIETDKKNSSNHLSIKDQAGLKGKIQVSKIEIIKQKHQAKVTNKPTTVHNSIEAHILYKPIAENSQPPSQMFPNDSGFQVPKQHISQPIYQKPGNHLQYPPSYTEDILPNNIIYTNSEVNKGIPPQLNMSNRPSLEGNGAISAQMAFNSRPQTGANGLSPSQSTTINGVNEGIPPQMESNVRLMSAGVKCGNPPLMTFNIPLPGEIARMSPQMVMNESTAGVNGEIPQQVARNDRPIPTGVSDMLPGKIVWSYEFPPPNPPPPPPSVPPTSQEIPGFPSISQAVNSSIIGKNNDGIINMNIRPSLEGNGAISAQIAFNSRPQTGANELSPSQYTTINGVNEGILPQLESNVRLMSAEVKCGNPPLMTFNIPFPGEIARMPPQMAMNDSTAGVIGDIPQQVTRNDRPMPSAVSDMLPGKNVYELPPPNPPPPPPSVPPTSQEIPGFPSISQAVNCSIIDKNNDGIIKKMNITTPVINQNTKTFTKKSIKVENIHSVSTPLYDEIATVDNENSVSNIIKSEIFQEPDKVTHRIKTAESHACFAIPRNSLPLQSNGEPINIKIKERAQPSATNKKCKTTIPIETNDTYVTISKSVLPDKCHESAVHNLRSPLDGYYKGYKNSKEVTSVDKPTINRLTHSKAPPIKPNESTATSSITIQPQLSENNPRSVGNTKSETSHLKTRPTKYKPSTMKRISHLFEDSTRLAINPKITDSDPVHLKNTQTSINVAKDAPPVKYKPGPLSKKTPFHNKKEKEKDSPGPTMREQFLPSKGYSDPILPIPTYESFLSKGLDSCNKLLDRPVKNTPFDQEYAKMKNTCSMNLDEPPRNQSSKGDRIITLEEYKKKKLANERRNQKSMADFDTKKDLTFKNNTADMPRRASYVDSDLGYDSDSTVIL